VSECLAVAFWRNRDNRARVGLRFNVSGRWASERDVVALPVGQRFNVSRRWSERDVVALSAPDNVQRFAIGFALPAAVRTCVGA